MSKILPSILDVSDLNAFLDVLDKINAKDKFKIKKIHVDIMDGIFVANNKGNLNAIKTLNNRGYFSDVHLMVEAPEEMIKSAIELGANRITIHYEINNFKNCFEYLLELKNTENIMIGISICPETEIAVLKPFLNKIDSVLIMSVYPGKGGQSFIDSTYQKISDLRKIAPYIKIVVDGGINNTNIAKVINYGADEAVVGSYITKDINDIENRIKTLKQLM